jgi:hypothetical protein
MSGKEQSYAAATHETSPAPSSIPEPTREVLKRKSQKLMVLVTKLNKLNKKALKVAKRLKIHRIRKVLWQGSQKDVEEIKSLHPSHISNFLVIQTLQKRFSLQNFNELAEIDPKLISGTTHPLLEKYFSFDLLSDFEPELAQIDRTLTGKPLTKLRKVNESQRSDNFDDPSDSEISKSSEESDIELAERAKPSKNRKGQRERRKQNEQKYGLNARHLVRQAEQNSVNLSKTTQIEKTSTEKLHPSWEAKKRLKEKEANLASLPKPTKVVFED